MLNLGVAKLEKAGLLNNVTTHLSDANNLTQFEDNLFDIYLISFGLRNIPNYKRTIAESYRVLKPNGKIFAMELSKIQCPDFHRMFKLYSSVMSEVVFKNISCTFEQQKEYVEDTMDAFPSQEDLRGEFLKSGYKNVSYENLLNGVACIYQANK
jgi:demethylmenaquinone methyltransferase / 2-methoxy-6-polyprenyl-1,4-benzoquinol methylase